MTKKIRIASQRGTSSRVIEYQKSRWAGHDFQEDQIRAMSMLPRGLMISRLRGTKSVLVSVYPEIEKMLSRKGYVICTSKGTASVVL